MLRVGTSGDYAPFTSAAGKAHFSGLDIDIADALARDLDFDVRFIRFAWPTLPARLAAGDFDLVLSGVTMRPERALIGRYTRPYAMTGAVALVRASDAARFASVDGLNEPGIRLVVNRGGHLERVARERFPRANIETVEDNRTLPQRVLDQTADAALSDSAEARVWSRPGLQVVGPFTHDYKAVLLAADQGELAARVDAWLAARERDGWLAQRRAHWLGNAAPRTAAEAQRETVAAFIQLRLSLMPAVGAAKREAGLPIVDPEQEARVVTRVAGLAGNNPQPVIDLYRELIALAIAVQHAQPSAPASATLASLRDAIARIDEQLVAEVLSPLGGTASEWQIVLDQTVDLPGIDQTARDRLATLLSRVSVSPAAVSGRG